jgi:hypothetical protein
MRLTLSFLRTGRAVSAISDIVKLKGLMTDD